VISRTRQIDELRKRLNRNPVVGLLGARQVGKTTLARQVADRWPTDAARFDLENERDLARLTDPFLALEELRGLVVLDEIQRRPDLFPTLRVLADRPRTPSRFLVLGSASPDLLRQSSETLAGRIHYRTLDGFATDEVGADRLETLWLRGGFPRSFLARTAADSMAWRRDLVRTFLERELPQLGTRVPAATIRRFWTMLAHYHGQIWNASEFARSLGTNHKSARSYLDLLESAMVVRVLRPWHENLKKRQVKSPKVYVTDSGLLHALLGIPSRRDLLGHPKVGASWEGFLLGQILARLRVEDEEAYFWAAHSGPELDLLVVRGIRRIGFEFKLTVSPTVTPSMRAAKEALGLSRLHVVHAGDESFPLGRGIQALAASRIWTDLPALR
jgi:predicted AAA+ superfamily ATPase